MTPDFDSKKVIMKSGRVNDEQGTGHKDMHRKFRSQPIPDFTAVKVSLVVQLCRSHAYHMSDFKAVSVVEWYNMHAHACHMPNFKAVKVSEVEWYNMLVTCQTSRQ